MPTAATPNPGTSTPEANRIVSSSATSVPPVKEAPLIKKVGICHAKARTRYGTRRRGTDPLSSSRHGFGLNVYPARKKEHRHVKREDRVPQGRRIWDGVPHNDQNHCNPLYNIDPVEPFVSHGEPFKTAAHKMKKAQTTKRSGLNKRWCSMADSNRRPWD